MSFETREQEIPNEELDRQISVDIMSSAEFTIDGKPLIKCVFIYRCFCGFQSSKSNMYVHLISDHGYPAGAVQMILNMSPIKQENAPSSGAIK